MASFVRPSPNAAPSFADGPDDSAEVSRRSVIVEDASLQGSMQPWLALECYQLSPGRRLAQVDSLDFGDQWIFRESQFAAIHKLGATARNLCTVSCCTPMPGSRLSKFSSGEAAEVFFLPESTEFDIFVPAGATTTYVSFDQDAFHRGARALDPARWEHSPSQPAPFAAARQTAFMNVLHQIWEQTEARSAAGDSIDPAMLRGLILQGVLLATVAASSGTALASTPDRARAYEVCRMARSYVTERLALGIVPTLPELCTVTNVSERTLQYAFRRYVGMTPLAYLRVCRLNSVRRELRDPKPDTTVTTAALRYGFLHLGRFANDYKRLFGESPSRELVHLR